MIDNLADVNLDAGGDEVAHDDGELANSSPVAIPLVDAESLHDDVFITDVSPCGR